MSANAAQIRTMIRRLSKGRVWLAAAALLLAAAASAHCDDIDYREAHRLVQEGRILPLAEILERVQSEVPGQVIEVELELDDGVYEYELKIISPDGKVLEVEVDAASGKILDIEDDD
jgi:uncharacterized membrane protein YkoI